MFGVKAQCRLDVFVPVAPIVGAGKLDVFVCHADFLQMRVKFAVLVEQKVAGAAVNAKRGALDAIAPRFEVGSERENVVFAADGIGAGDALELGFIVAPIAVREAVSARMTVGAGEQIRMLQSEFDGAVAAHRKPADGASSTLGASVESAVDKAD